MASPLTLVSSSTQMKPLQKCQWPTTLCGRKLALSAIIFTVSCRDKELKKIHEIFTEVQFVCEITFMNAYQMVVMLGTCEMRHGTYSFQNTVIICFSKCLYT